MKVFDFDIEEVDYIVQKNYQFKDKYSISNYSSYRLFYVISGEVEFRFNDGTTRLKTGDLVLLKPLSEYDAEVLSQEDYKFITVSFMASGDFSWFNSSLTLVENQNLTSDFTSAYDSFEFQDETFLLKAKALIYNSVQKILAFNRKDTSSYDEIERAIAFIKSNYMKKISLEEISAVAGCSISHFKFKFYKKTKTSPIKFLNEFRLNRAEDLLRSGLYNVSETANLCGFSNVHYFSNAFKKFFGFSPKTYLTNRG